MSLDSIKINQIFLSAQNSTEILEGLYKSRKAFDPKFSHTYIAKRVKFSSRNYFSDVISGRRKLPQKFLRAICEIFKLDVTQAKILELLLKREKNKIEDVEFQSEMKRLRRILQDFEPKPKPLGKGPLLFLSFQVLSAIKSRASPLKLSDLYSLVSNAPQARVKEALQLLADNNLVKITGDTIFFEDKSTIFISGMAADDADLYHAALDHTKENVSKFQDSSETFFQAINFYVNRDEFRKKLSLFKLKFREIQDELFESDGNMSVQVNIQIYPT